MIKKRVSNRSQNNMGEITKSTRAYALPTQSQPIALSTEFTYDSWGRMLQIVYPDGEILNYGYDRGGQLKSMQGVKDSCTYNYLINQKYDKFGAKTEMAYGNYMVTKYIYNPLNLRLDSLAVSLQLNNYLTMGYDYDAKGNVTSLNSTYTWLSNDSIIRQTFTYDSTDQLTAAMGKINNRTSLYNVAVTYGNWGKIRGYTTSMNGTDTFMYPTTNLTSTHFAPESSVNNGQTTIYDFGINGSLRKKAKGDTTEYYLFNANNCMKAYSNNAEQYAYYGYDASGERTYKLSANTITISTNGLITVQALDVQNIMLYPNGYLNINQNGEYTKHYYADALRIASKIGSGFNQDICDSANAIDSAYLSNRILEQNTVIQNNLYEVALTDSIDTLILSNPYPDFCNLQGNGGQETGLFYYHPDHLGSTGMVTDNNATVTQGFLYAPFGEILTEYNPSWQNGQVPKYSFNAKELDEENGMYYYSARYYAPPTFISRDPMFEKYPSISPYTYCANNPLKFVDPTGMSTDDPPGDGNNPYKNQPIGYESGKGTEKNPIVLPDIIITSKKSESQGLGGYRLTNNDNERPSNERKTRKDVGTWDITGIIPLFESFVNTFIDLVDKIAGFFNKSKPTTTPEPIRDNQEEYVDDGYIAEYHNSKTGQKQTVWLEEEEDSIKMRKWWGNWQIVDTIYPNKSLKKNK